MVGRCRSSSSLSIADPGQRFNGNGRKIAVFALFADERRRMDSGVKYLSRVSLRSFSRDLMGGRRRPLERHVPTLALFARSSSQRHFQVQTGGVPGLTCRAAAELDVERLEEIVRRIVVAVAGLDP